MAPIAVTSSLEGGVHVVARRHAFGMDNLVAALAERQHGVFTLAQVVALGMSRGAVRHRVATGTWERMDSCVYRLVGVPSTWRQRLLALSLAARPAAVSHRAAAALLGIPGFPEGPVDVTSPRPRRHRSALGVVHRWRVLPDHHLTVVDGITTTRVPRVLVDLAGVLHPRRTARTVDTCIAHDMVTVPSLQATFDDLATRGRAGIAVMRTILEERAGDFVPPASHLEARFLEVIRAYGLPEPVRQLDVGNGEKWVGRVDFAYPEHKLLIEVDSRRHHMSKVDFEADRRRDNELMAAGWRVIRITWAQLQETETVVVSTIRRALTAAAA